MNFPGYPPAISHIRKFKILIKNGHVGHAHGKINGKIIDCKPGRCFIRSRLWQNQRLFLGPSTGLWGTIIHFHHVFQLPTPQVDGKNRGILKEWSEYIHRKFMYGNLFWGWWSSSSLGNWFENLSRIGGKCQERNKRKNTTLKRKNITRDMRWYEKTFKHREVTNKPTMELIQLIQLIPNWGAVVFLLQEKRKCWVHQHQTSVGCDGNLHQTCASWFSAWSSLFKIPYDQPIQKGLCSGSISWGGDLQRNPSPTCDGRKRKTSLLGALGFRRHMISYFWSANPLYIICVCIYCIYIILYIYIYPLYQLYHIPMFAS